MVGPMRREGGVVVDGMNRHGICIYIYNKASSGNNGTQWQRVKMAKARQRAEYMVKATYLFMMDSDRWHSYLFRDIFDMYHRVVAMVVLFVLFHISLSSSSFINMLVMYYYYHYYEFYTEEKSCIYTLFTHPFLDAFFVFPPSSHDY